MARLGVACLPAARFLGRAAAAAAGLLAGCSWLLFELSSRQRCNAIYSGLAPIAMGLPFKLAFTFPLKSKYNADQGRQAGWQEGDVSREGAG